MKYSFIVYLDLFEKAFLNWKEIKHLKKILLFGIVYKMPISTNFVSLHLASIDFAVLCLGSITVSRAVTAPQDVLFCLSAFCLMTS